MYTHHAKVKSITIHTQHAHFQLKPLKSPQMLRMWSARARAVTQVLGKQTRIATHLRRSHREQPKIFQLKPISLSRTHCMSTSERCLCASLTSVAAKNLYGIQLNTKIVYVCEWGSAFFALLGNRHIMQTTGANVNICS